MSIFAVRRDDIAAQLIAWSLTGMRVASGTTSRGSNLALTDEIIDDLESQRADSTLTFSFTRRLAKRMCVS